MDDALEIGVIVRQRADGAGKHDDAQCQRKDVRLRKNLTT